MFPFGVDYYPEQWPEARWAEDARLMAEAGFNVVRLAEFAWSKMEPRAGHFDFDWLDRAIAILAEHGLRVILGTPTASPPAWLMTANPDLFRVREDGQRLSFGNRREYCPSHPVYHEYARRIVTRLAEHFARHPAVIGWQIDNEFGERCYCPVCAQAFRAWLRRRYESLDEVNQKWGTAFWGHQYSEWDQIPQPLAAGGAPNPGLALDYYRFASDAYVAFQQQQVEVLKARCPGHFVTHNFMGFGSDRLNYYNLARPLDLVAWDNYPRTQWSLQVELDPSQAALSADAMRGLKRRNFWVVEQQAGQGGWEVVSVAPRPGELRLWAYQAIAHGADGLLFFRWRTARFGAEQYWHGLLEHDARPGRRYAEIKRMGAELRRIGPLVCQSSVRAQAALLQSYDSRFAFQIQANNPGFNYSHHFHQVYRAFHRRHLALDVIAPGEDLSAYRLVVAPALHILAEAEADRLRRFVQDGGVLAVTPRSGVKDENNAVVEQPLPGLLAELCGVQVEEYDSLPAGATQPLEGQWLEAQRGEAMLAETWCDILTPTTADVIASYTASYYAGRPAITRNRYGRGQALYVGTFGNAHLWSALARRLLSMAGLGPVLEAPDGVELAERWQAGRRLLFVLNHSQRDQQLALDRPYRDLLDADSSMEGAVVLAPHAVLILEEVDVGR